VSAALQRILMDVLGCSLREICEVMDFSLAAVKRRAPRTLAAAELADEPDDRPAAKYRSRSRSPRRLRRAFQCPDFDAIPP